MADAEIGQKLARMLGDLAVHMQAQRGTSDTLRSIVDAAARIVMVPVGRVSR